MHYAIERKHSNLAFKASNSKCILRNGTNPFFSIMYASAGFTKQEVHDQSKTLAPA